MEFIIYILKGFAAFLSEFIPLLFKTSLLMSPFLLLVYCSYLFGGLKIAVPSTIFVVVIIIIGFVWARKRNITDKSLSPALVFLCLFFDAGFIISSLIYTEKIKLKPRIYTEKTESGEKIEGLKLEKEKARELRIRTFLDALKQSVSNENESYWMKSDFLHIMGKLKEINAYNEVPVPLIIDVLNKIYLHVDEGFFFPQRDRYREICEACIDFFVAVKAKEACELLYKIQTKEGYLYNTAKKASLKICSQ